MGMHKMFEVVSDVARNTRSEYHLTLKGAIDHLSQLPAEFLVQFDWNGLSPRSVMSYRGYYSDLAISCSDAECSVGTLLSLCQRALGNTYQGYKGGDNLMDENTPLWAAEYGDSGRAIMGIQVTDEQVVLTTKEIH